MVHTGKSVKGDDGDDGGESSQLYFFLSTYYQVLYRESLPDCPIFKIILFIC